MNSAIQSLIADRDRTSKEINKLQSSIDSLLLQREKQEARYDKLCDAIELLEQIAEGPQLIGMSGGKKSNFYLYDPNNGKFYRQADDGSEVSSFGFERDSFDFPNSKFVEIWSD